MYLTGVHGCGYTRRYLQYVKIIESSLAFQGRCAIAPPSGRRSSRSGSYKSGRICAGRLSPFVISTYAVLPYHRPPPRHRGGQLHPRAAQCLRGL